MLEIIIMMLEICFIKAKRALLSNWKCKKCPKSEQVKTLILNYVYRKASVMKFNTQLFQFFNLIKNKHTSTFPVRSACFLMGQTGILHCWIQILCLLKVAYSHKTANLASGIVLPLPQSLSLTLKHNYQFISSSLIWSTQCLSLGGGTC